MPPNQKLLVSIVTRDPCVMTQIDSVDHKPEEHAGSLALANP